jgi:hypothetical protein
MNAWENIDCPGKTDGCPELPCGQKCLYKVLILKAVVDTGDELSSRGIARHRAASRGIARPGLPDGLSSNQISQFW